MTCSYFMCRFLEILFVKKRRNLSGGKYFPITEYFPHAENLEQPFCSSAFVDKILRANIISNLFDQLLVNMGKYLLQKGKVCEND